MKLIGQVTWHVSYVFKHFSSLSVSRTCAACIRQPIAPPMCVHAPTTTTGTSFYLTRSSDLYLFSSQFWSIYANLYVYQWYYPHFSLPSLIDGVTTTHSHCNQLPISSILSSPSNHQLEGELKET